MELVLLSLLFGAGAIAGLLGGGGDTSGQQSGGAPNNGDDVIDGTAGNDRIEAGAGNDIVNSFAGDDLLFLGIGDDTANAGEDDDRIFAGGGKDVVTGGPGDDEVFLEGGDDISLGIDLLGVPQDGGDDIIRGGPANDQISDRFGTNELYGDEGADVLNAVDDTGDDTPDTIFGGFGADSLVGDDGDLLSGGEGEDDFAGRFDEVGEDPIRIADFDSTTETLVLQFDSGTFAPVNNADLSYVVDAPSNEVRIFVGGVLFAVLEDTNTIPANVTVQMI